MVVLLDGANSTCFQSQTSGAYEVLISESTAIPVSLLRRRYGKLSATAPWCSNPALLKNYENLCNEIKFGEVWLCLSSECSVELPDGSCEQLNC